MKYSFTIQKAYDEIKTTPTNKLKEWKREIEKVLKNKNTLHKNVIDDNECISDLIDEELKHRDILLENN